MRNGEEKKRKTVVPYVSTNVPPASQQTPKDSLDNALKRALTSPPQLNQTLPAPQVSRPAPKITGPKLVPGKGGNGISFVNGHYVDDSTGEFIEDLSGLPITTDMVYNPATLTDYGGFPSVAIPERTTPGIVPRQVIKLAPGIDSTHPDLDKTDPRRVHQVKHVATSFDEAWDVLTDSNQEIFDPVGVAISINNQAHPRNPTDSLIAGNVELNPQNPLWKPSSSGLSATPWSAHQYGIDLNLPVPNEIYYPAGPYSERQNSLNRAITAINQAKQAEEVVTQMHSMASATDIQNWNSTYPPHYHITPENIERAERAADNAWANAATILEQVQQENIAIANQHLSDMRFRNVDRPDHQSRALFVQHGQIAEMAETLMKKHITSDQSVMDRLGYMRRAQQEDMAKRLNARARRKLGQAGRKNESIFDGQVDKNGRLILDPHGDAVVSNAPIRSPQEILDLTREHRANGALIPPEIDSSGQFILSDLDVDDIENLARMGDAHTAWDAGDRTAAGHPNLAGQTFDSGVGQMMMASWWEYSGYSGLPVLLHEDEIEAMLDGFGPDGSPHAVAITRGVKPESGTVESDFVEQNLRGDRFIVGQGASASGRGEYWSGKPSGWRSWHGPNNGSQVGLITRDTKVTTTRVMDTLFTGSGGGEGDSHLYSLLWAFSNGHGAPLFRGGVNTMHGPEHDWGIPAKSLEPNPATGLYDIKAIEAHINRLTDDTPGQEGLATVEGWKRAHDAGGRPMPAFLQRQLFPGTTLSDQELVDEAQQVRQEINMWMAQHLNWFLQLASMARDETHPTDGVANKEWNRKLNVARRTLLYMSRENRAALMGYDGIIAGSPGDQHTNVLPSLLWAHPNSGIVNEMPHVYLILNRSGHAYYRRPTKWEQFRDMLNPKLKNHPIKW